MNFTSKPNTGALFRNEQKTTNQPDMRGDINLDRDFLNSLLQTNKQSLIKLSLSGWTKESSAGKKYLSLTVQEPYVSKTTSVDDGDIPF